MPVIPNTDLSVSRLCLGGNVFGWTADTPTSHAILDAFVDGGGTFIDTADMYSCWADGNEGGESERVIGAWLQRRGRHDDVVIATKVGKLPGLTGLHPDTIATACEASLERLGVDCIDLYYAHADDPDVPLADVLGAFDRLVEAGKVRHIAASNFTGERLRAALDTSKREGLARYVALQPHYNLVERDYEDALAPTVLDHELACFPYFALAKGFLTGKYRPDGPEVRSARAGGASAYLDERGIAVLDALDTIAAEHDAPVPAVALAWLAQQPSVTAPIASARTLDQLAGLLPALTLELTDEELGALDAASA